MSLFRALREAAQSARPEDPEAPQSEPMDPPQTMPSLGEAARQHRQNLMKQEEQGRMPINPDVPPEQPQFFQTPTERQEERMAQVPQATAESVQPSEPQELVRFDFLEQVEGLETAGYVPTEDDGTPLGQSGPTIASGFDLGQHSLQDLRAMGMPSHLVGKLKPYLGVQGEAAQELVEDKPLQLTEDEARKINSIVKPRKVDQVRRKFNRATKGPKFEELPPEWRTVISSVAFQHGDLAKKAPNFWKQVTSGQWDKAVDNLRDFGDEFATRRNKEADMVETVRP